MFGRVCQKQNRLMLARTVICATDPPVPKSVNGAARIPASAHPGKNT